jgi:hypothetical protein
MTKSRFQIAKGDIVEYFERQGSKVYNINDISRILDNNRKFWRLPVSLSSEDFAKLLITYTQLKFHNFEFMSKIIQRFTWGNVSIFRIAASLEKNAYLSHYTALFLHGLTDQIPKKIYVTYEQPPKIRINKTLSQLDIDNAFHKPLRVSNNVAKYQDNSICLLNGQFSNNLGVVTITNDTDETNIVTDIERTLIDITVRPVYSGGIFEVLSAFRKAVNKVSINKLAARLKTLDYIYPYHQAIGFYLEKAGNYRDTQIELLKSFDIKYDFYLDHAVEEVGYSKEWKLYYPKNF